MKIKWKLFDYVNAFLMLLIALICIYPLIYVVSGAFNEGVDYLPLLSQYENDEIAKTPELF